MKYIDLLYQVPEELRRTFRLYESVNKKLINLKWSIVFNSTCLKENILPNYSKIRHHDPAVATTTETMKYRRYLIEREIDNKVKDKTELENRKSQYENVIDNFECNQESKTNVKNHLNSMLQNSDRVAKSRIIKKLNSLYQGQTIVSEDKGKNFVIKENVNNFINLSDHQLTEDEKQFLNLGLNCHLQPKYDKLHKKVELEVLYQNLINLESKNQITTSADLIDQLRCESTKHRYKKHNSLLTPHLRTAAQNLRNNDKIVIRKADKSSLYVILNKEEYLTKLDSILKDTSKFKRITRNPIEKLQTDANKLIETLNAVKNDLGISKIIGDFKPGYAYGNIKTHKEGNPIRPIISQIPTPTYNLAKRLNQIISQYIPNQYCLKSSADFIDLLQTNKQEGIIASLDVESLFTNVPIDDTIQIIIQEVYNHEHLPPPQISAHILQELLQLCTKKAPFKCPKGNMYVQIEGVAMGSPLGPTFANFYMGNLEKTIFSNSDLKPSIYARYVDDTFVQVKNEEELINLKNQFQNNSKLNFTYELSVNNKLPFLDVLVEPHEDTFNTQVYHKPTDNGNCMNGDSECPEKYKVSVITNYLNRAYKVSKTWKEFHTEILHIKQRLINNNYTNTMVDQEIKKFLTQKETQNTKRNKNILPIYYESQMHANYKTEERIIKKIIYDNTKCINPDNKLELRIYYRNKKTSQLIMRNNLNPPPSCLQQTNVVYEFTCPMSHSQVTKYIGFTQTTLSQRLTSHGQNGSIWNHFKEIHNNKPTREQLTNNTNIIAKSKDRLRLAIKEALLITDKKPEINKQYNNFTNILRLHKPKSEHKMQHINYMSTTLPLSQEDIIQPTIEQAQPIENSTSQIIENIQTKPISEQTQHHEHFPFPLGPFSQRTHRLLNSPIKINSINNNTQPDTDNLSQYSLPDMEMVLQRFGIETNISQTNNTENMDNNNTSDIDIEYVDLETDTNVTTNDTKTDAFISQRIRTMDRKCKNSQNNNLI